MQNGASPGSSCASTIGKGRSVGIFSKIRRELVLAISGSRIARLFRSCIGIGVREYAKRKRLLICSAAIEKSDSVSQRGCFESRSIALHRIFNVKFKQLLSVTPTEFRELCEKELHFGRSETSTNRQPPLPNGGTNLGILLSGKGALSGVPLEEA